jgi:hypothetical protein
VGAGVAGVAAVPSVLRTAAVEVLLFAVCGYAPARVLVGGPLAPWRPLFVLPLGATISGLVMAALGVLHVPFAVSLSAVLAAALVADAWVLRNGGRRGIRAGAPGAGPRAGAPSASARRRIALPLALAAIVAAISLVPVFRSGFATIPGQNGDAILVVGSATFVEHAPPTAQRLDLPINHIPLQWRSKYPIYYALAAVSALAGQDPIAAFAPLSALLLALTALGFYVFARYALRAPPWVALLAVFLIPLDRILMYVTVHPYYNELWGQFALPFFLLCGWHYLREPSRRSLTLTAIFGVFSLLAYPLVIPFPVFFFVPAVAAIAWRRPQRDDVSSVQPLAARARQPWRRPWVWLAALVLMLPLAVLVRGFFEKTLSALAVLAPWTSLANWHGTALPYITGPRFFGLPGSGALDYAGMVGVCVLAVVGLRRVAAPARIPLATMTVASALVGLYFRVRTDGELFWFKDMSFLGPYVLLAALVGIASLITSAARARAAIGVAAAAAALVVVPIGAAREIDSTFDNATRGILGLRVWNRELPRGSSVRIDVPPGGTQLWVTYMFKDHRICSLHPLGGFFPHPALSRKADFVIAERIQPRPLDATGAPLLRNQQFELWRMNPALPGPDLCSRQLGDITSVAIGF